MTPDLPTRVREAFEAPEVVEAVAMALREDNHAIMPLNRYRKLARVAVAAIPDAALAAVIAVVQEDAAERIGAWLRHIDRLDEIPGAKVGMPTHNPLWDAGMAIIREFGGTTHD